MNPPHTATATRLPAAPDPRGRVECDGLVKIYEVGDREVVALQGLDLLVEAGELVAIVGASGSGKSTLLNILAGLDTPSAGRAHVGGHDLVRMSTADRVRYRRETIGFVWQQTTRNLLPYLSARENIELPLRLAGVGRARRQERVADLLDLSAIAASRADRRPAGLSGGEQQRVAVAVALANGPEVLLADEPTGELDAASSARLFELLQRTSQEAGTTVVVLTHDPLVSEEVDRTVRIRDGRTANETLRRRSTGDDEVIAQEYAVLDAVGRLQLPREYVEALQLERRVRLELEADHVGLWPDVDRVDRAGRAGRAAPGVGTPTEGEA